MDISVIIPSYNRSGLLPRALDSVLKQSFPANEIIVVDDGSEDDTPELISGSYPQVTLVHQVHSGVSKARNTGIHHSRCEWIAFLDSDDAWHPEKLQQQCEWITGHREYRIVHSDEIWLRNGRRINPKRKHGKSGGKIFRNCLPLCCISPSAVMINRSVFSDVGWFDETLPACEDYDLWLRICARYPVGYIDQPLVYKYGGHADQLSRRFWGMDRFRVRALNRIISSGVLAPEDLEAAREVLLQKLSVLINGARKHRNREILDECERLLGRHGPAANQKNPDMPALCTSN